ncbi:MAG TPA: hypothetical protein VL346_07985 [Acidobacteriaceae bacterium]|nr:hypothetical protein [Acidobacteriaceae bacterium]
MLAGAAFFSVASAGKAEFSSTFSSPDLALINFWTAIELEAATLDGSRLDEAFRALVIDRLRISVPADSILFPDATRLFCFPPRTTATSSSPVSSVSAFAEATRSFCAARVSFHTARCCACRLSVALALPPEVSVFRLNRLPDPAAFLEATLRPGIVETSCAGIAIGSTAAVMPE